MDALFAITLGLIWVLAVTGIVWIAWSAWQENRGRLVDRLGRAYFPKPNLRFACKRNVASMKSMEI
ncbi:MAG: hypothetical protein R3B95_11685 [Nitrospirales bacterium]|nr:hypothetical protein [Nitrospirales bacterium]